MLKNPTAQENLEQTRNSFRKRTDIQNYDS